MQSNMASSSRVHSLTLHDACTTLAGFIMLGVGTCCLVAQLLTPWTVLGSFFYGISGVSLLAYKSEAFRDKFISHMSNIIRKSICDKSIMELMRHDSPLVQLIAFIMACSVLSSSDVHQLADSLPNHFDGLKKLPALQYITGSNVVLCRDKLKDDKPTAYPSILNRIVTSVIYRAVPSAAHDRFYTKLVELGAKTASEKVGKHLTSMVTQKLYKASCRASEMLREMWEKWFATLGVISATSVGYWCLQTSSFQTILQNVSCSNRKNVLLLWNNLMRKITVDRAVVLGMGLLGGVAAAAASLNAHNILLDFDDLSPADSKARDVTLGKGVGAVTEKCVKDISLSVFGANNFESCPPTREQLLQVHAFIRDLLPTNNTYQSRLVTTTNAARPKFSVEAKDITLLRMCVILVTLFAHRMECRKENYAWLLYVYYARLKTLSKLKRTSN